MKKSTAQLSWSLWIECPHCSHDFDLADYDEEGQWSTPIFNNEWDKLSGEEVECPECTKVFQIEEVEC